MLRETHLLLYMDNISWTPFSSYTHCESPHVKACVTQ